ncbi:6616_t:CDS:2 [Entrophospora sp. SA101]|nr:5971_t:CDS:2 [Entrophospora candida]CAH1757441.1 11889_t:CDS:2 [Entrophospora sp. SA101]CAG8482533.1 14446_t:CDS:2 [Entrophospora candida]CAJ0636768.1 6616_t:CDS:2 [Entrophospora sp. SA101]CAJ0832159.1 11544_t:CDS:2 [Entrophospora sp. SA101]
MLKPKAISSVLRQATTGGVKATLLLNSEGSPLAFVSESDNEARVYAAIASSIWSTIDKIGKSVMKDDLNFLVIECEEGNVAIATVSNMLLCLVAKPEVQLGILKAKTDALIDHLKEPFKKIAAYTQS